MAGLAGVVPIDQHAGLVRGEVFGAHIIGDRERVDSPLPSVGVEAARIFAMVAQPLPAENELGGLSRPVGLTLELGGEDNMQAVGVSRDLDHRHSQQAGGWLRNHTTPEVSGTEQYDEDLTSNPPEPLDSAAAGLHESQRFGTPVGQILRPTSLRQALQLLAEQPSARPLAGGTDLLLDLQRSGHDSGQAEPVALIDLTAIADFSQILESDESFLIGGGVAHNQIVGDQRIVDHALPLAQACLEIGSPQLRNRATLAGNLITASPANDSISALMALGASVVLERWDGDAVVRRTVAVADFFTGFRQTTCAADELLTEIHVPKMPSSARGIWVKLGLRKAQAISVVHSGIVVDLDADAQITSAVLALGSVAATVVVVPEFGELLIGRQLDDALISEAGATAARSVDPIDDVRATAEYRRATIATVVERSLHAIAAGVHGSQWPTDPPLLAMTADLAVAAEAPQASLDDQPIAVEVNGELAEAAGAQMTLLDWIRDRASSDTNPLSGVKEGCAEGECGACTVHLNNVAVMSCLVAAGQADGSSVVTVEGLRTTDGLHPIQSEFVNEFAVQCGYCIPGFLTAGARLLDENPSPSDDQIRLALSGNLCRCTGYYPIIDAVRSAGTQLGGTP